MRLDREHMEQAALVSWARANERSRPELRMLLAIPNGGARSKATAGRLKAEGVRAGVPDLALPVARGGFHGLWIEMKSPATPGKRAGVLSSEQRRWIVDLSREGFCAVVAYGWDEAREFIEEYLSREAVTA